MHVPLSSHVQEVYCAFFKRIYYWPVYLYALSFYITKIIYFLDLHKTISTPETVQSNTELELANI